MPGRESGHSKRSVNSTLDLKIGIASRKRTEVLMSVSMFNIMRDLSNRQFHSYVRRVSHEYFSQEVTACQSTSKDIYMSESDSPCSNWLSSLHCLYFTKPDW